MFCPNGIEFQIEFYSKWKISGLKYDLNILNASIQVLKIHFIFIRHLWNIYRVQNIGNKLNQAKIRKFEFAEKILFKNGNFIKVKEYQIPEYCFTSKWFQIIVSCVRIKSRLILKKYSNTSLNSKGNKKGSLYLDTL